MGDDAIYATNKKRNFITKHGIRTDFKRKCKAKKHEKQRSQMAAAITKERASRLEGSFGRDNEHNHLKRIRARTKKNRDFVDILRYLQRQCAGDRQNNCKNGSLTGSVKK